MASSTPNIVLLQVNGSERPIFEAPAASAITPGDLVSKNSSGNLASFSGANTLNSRMFALENPFASDPTQTALAQQWASGDSVHFIYGAPGDVVNARLAASQTIAIGDVLGPSATAGCLAKITTVDATVVVDAPVGIAEEAVTTTGSTGRIKVRIL